MTDSDQEDLIAIKQAYLREEIMAKGYDPDKFISYLEDSKGIVYLMRAENEADINSWTLEELKEVVKKFQKENQSKDLKDYHKENKEEAFENIKGDSNNEDENKNEIDEYEIIIPASIYKNPNTKLVPTLELPLPNQVPSKSFISE